MANETLILTKNELIHVPGVKERAKLAERLREIAPKAASALRMQEALENTEVRFSLMAA